jgi:hypothetical protein
MPRKPVQRRLPFPSPPGLVCAAGRAEPTLWVRRIVLWHDVSKETIRNIALHRGLNIVWSPTGSDPKALATGHAAGKTLFSPTPRIPRRSARAFLMERSALRSGFEARPGWFGGDSELRETIERRRRRASTGSRMRAFATPSTPSATRSRARFSKRTRGVFSPRSQMFRARGSTSSHG